MISVLANKVVFRKVKLGVLETERIVEIAQGDTYEALLMRLGINPVEVIVLCDGRSVPEDDEVDITGEVKIIRIVSGG